MTNYVNGAGWSGVLGSEGGARTPSSSPGQVLHGQVCDVRAHGVCQLPALKVTVMLLELGRRGPPEAPGSPRCGGLLPSRDIATPTWRLALKSRQGQGPASASLTRLGPASRTLSWPGGCREEHCLRVQFPSPPFHQVKFMCETERLSDSPDRSGLCLSRREGAPWGSGGCTWAWGGGCRPGPDGQAGPVEWGGHGS